MEQCKKVGKEINDTIGIILRDDGIMTYSMEQNK